MKFLVDRCAGHRLADWLRSEGHDVVEVSGQGPDPGDRAILEQAFSTQRVLITIDTDFGLLVYAGGMAHAGLVRLPDVPAEGRIQIFTQLLQDHEQDLVGGAVITVSGGRVRISHRRSGP